MLDRHRFWTERSVPGSPSWPFFRGRALSRYRFACQYSPGKRVLDVACGVGYGTRLLATHGAALEVVGVDISAEAISHAKAHYAVPNVTFLCANANDAARLGIGVFDLVVSMGTLEHIERPIEFVHAVRDILQPRNGLWILTMLSPATHNGSDPYHYQELDTDSLRNLLTCGFVDVTILGHRFRSTGRVKQDASAHILRAIPSPIKRAAKALLGPSLTWKLSMTWSRPCTPDDYEFSETNLDDALEFAALCRQPRA